MVLIIILSIKYIYFCKKIINKRIFIIQINIKFMDYFFRLRFLISINLMFFFIHHLKIFYPISLNFLQYVSYLLNFLNLSYMFTIIA